MNRHQDMLDESRETKKTLYVVAAFYVTVGFALLVSSAMTGELLGTFLGFVMISGALAVTAVLRAVLRIGLRISAIEDRLEPLTRGLDASRAEPEFRVTGVTTRASPLRADQERNPSGKGQRVGEVQEGVSDCSGDAQPSGTPVTGDAPASPGLVIGPMGPATDIGAPVRAARSAGELTAGTLDRSSFPRLARIGQPGSRESTVESSGTDAKPHDPVVSLSPSSSELPSAVDDDPRMDRLEREALFANLSPTAVSCRGDLEGDDEITVREMGGAFDEDQPALALRGAGDDRPIDGAPVSFAVTIAMRNLVREGTIALRDGDLPAARRALLALEDADDDEPARRLAAAVEALADRTEQKLREEFSRSASRRDVAGLVGIGERIVEILPDREVAREVERLLPLLRRKLAPQALSAP